MLRGERDKISGDGEEKDGGGRHFLVESKCGHAQSNIRTGAQQSPELLTHRSNFVWWIERGIEFFTLSVGLSKFRSVHVE